MAGQRQEPVGGHHGVLFAAATLAADPAVADRDRARQHPGDVGIVGDQYDGRAVRAVDLRECCQDLVARVMVELARGLVAQEQARTGGDRDGDRGQLEPTGCQLAQRPVGVVGEPDLPEHLARVGERPAGPPCRVLGKSDVVVGRGVREQIAAGALQHQADLCRAQPVEVARRCGGHLGVAHEDLAGTGSEDAGQQAHQGRLARSGRSQQTDHLARRDVQVDAGDRGDVVFLDVVDVHQAAGSDRESAHQTVSVTRSR